MCIFLCVLFLWLVHFLDSKGGGGNLWLIIFLLFMNTLLSTLRTTVLHGSIALGALGFMVLAQTVITSLDDVAVDGDTLSAEWVNEVNTLDELIDQNAGDIAANQTDIEALQAAGSGSSPAGAVMAFYLTRCPTGWKPADGTNNTPDLRGVFLRGMENFGGQSSTRDPDRSGRSTLGSYQADAFGSHSHKINRDGSTPSGGGTKWSSGRIFRGTTNKTSSDQNSTTTSTGSSETRPKNVALLFCVKG